MDRVLITREPIDEAAVAASVARAEYGAVCTFSGVVRNHSRGKRVLSLEYTAHERLAITEMARIVAEAENRWNATCAVTHRIGSIPIGESSIFIAAGTPHRPEAFEACRWLIDTIKETVPIWKRETTEDGEVWIEGDRAIEALPRSITPAE